MKKWWVTTVIALAQGLIAGLAADGRYPGWRLSSDARRQTPHNCVQALRAAGCWQISLPMLVERIANGEDGVYLLGEQVKLWALLGQGV